MNKHINQLLQIQDLLFVLHENDILHKEKGTEERISTKLKKNIEEMKQSLPAEVNTEVDRIANRYEIFVVPMLNEVCTGCFMKLPVGVANNVKNTSKCINCPSCHRYLYEDFQTKRPGDNFHYKGIARFSSIDLMFPKITATNHADAITEIAKMTVDAGFVENGDDFAEALLQREAMASTAVGSGIAFPHARGIRSCGMTLAVGISEKGIDFGDGERVNLICLSAVPTQTSMFYMELVSKIARYFGKPESAPKMLECKTAEEMWKIFIDINF
jgi:mannitol/fructose-specific phosphotransferase system IIA component (Ntr-type)